MLGQATNPRQGGVMQSDAKGDADSTQKLINIE